MQHCWVLTGKLKNSAVWLRCHQNARNSFPLFYDVIVEFIRIKTHFITYSQVANDCEKSYIHNGTNVSPFPKKLKMRFEIKSHKFAVSLFIIEIHFSGGKVKLSHKKRVMEMRERERTSYRGRRKIKVTFCAGVTGLGKASIYVSFLEPLSTPYFAQWLNCLRLRKRNISVISLITAGG